MVTSAMLGAAAARRAQQNQKDRAKAAGQDTSAIDAKINKWTNKYENAWSQAAGKPYPVKAKSSVRSALNNVLPNRQNFNRSIQTNSNFAKQKAEEAHRKRMQADKKERDNKKKKAEDRAKFEQIEEREAKINQPEKQTTNDLFSIFTKTADQYVNSPDRKNFMQQRQSLEDQRSQLNQPTSDLLNPIVEAADQYTNSPERQSFMQQRQNYEDQLVPQNQPSSDPFALIAHIGEDISEKGSPKYEDQYPEALKSVATTNTNTYTNPFPAVEETAQQQLDQHNHQQSIDEEARQLVESQELPDIVNAEDLEATGTRRPTAQMDLGPEFDEYNTNLMQYKIDPSTGKIVPVANSILSDFDYGHELRNEIDQAERSGEDPDLHVEDFGELMSVGGTDRVMRGRNRDANGNFVVSNNESVAYHRDNNDIELDNPQWDEKRIRERKREQALNSLDPNDPHQKELMDAINRQNMQDALMNVISAPLSPTFLGDAYNLLQEGLMRAGSFIQDIPNMAREAWEGGKDYKLKTSEGREIDESDLLEAVSNAEKENLEHADDKVLALVDENNEVIGTMLPEQFREYAGHDFIEGDEGDATSAIGMFVDYEPNGAPVVRDIDGNVVYELDPNKDYEIKPIIGHQADITLPDGSTVSQEELDDIQNNIDTSRYVESNSNPLANIPGISDAIDYFLQDPSTYQDSILTPEGIGPAAFNAAFTTLPYLIPGFRELYSGAQMDAAIGGLDPFTYDWKTGTYKDPGVMTNGEYWANIGDQASQILGEYAVGIAGGLGKGVAKGAKNVAKGLGVDVGKGAASAAKNTTKAEKAINKNIKNLKSGVPARIAKEGVFGEGIEEVGQNIGSELSNLIFNREETGGGMYSDEATDAMGRPMYDQNGNIIYKSDTPIENRFVNAAKSLAPDFVLGGLLGGIMGAPGFARQRKADARRLASGDILPDSMKSEDYEGSLTDLDKERIREAYSKWLADHVADEGE